MLNFKKKYQLQEDIRSGNIMIYWRNEHGYYLRQNVMIDVLVPEVFRECH